MTTITKKAAKAAEVLANQKLAYAKKVRALTGHVLNRLPADALLVAFDAGISADEYAAQIASHEPVGRALHPQKADAVQSAAADAAVTIGKVRAELEAAGWDIEVAAPYPSSLRESRETYKKKAARRSLFSTLTRPVGTPRHGQPKIVEMSEQGAIRFINAAEEMAAAQYDQFICKMVSKVGPDVADATIVGDHIWAHSVLTVTLLDGTVQRWQTQQIWNYSVHGLRFPQWPSRIVK